MFLCLLEINLDCKTHFIFEYFYNLIFHCFLLEHISDIGNFIFKILNVFSLLDISLLEYFGSILHFWKKNQDINYRKQWLSHCSHKQNKQDCNNMERYINQLTALFDKSEVYTVLLDLPFLFFHEFFSPYGLIFDVYIVRQMVVQINLVVLVILHGKLILRICKFNLVLGQLFLNWHEAWMYNIIPVQWFWIIYPVDLSLGIWFQSSPLISIIFRWELPKNFL